MLFSRSFADQTRTAKIRVDAWPRATRSFHEDQVRRNVYIEEKETRKKKSNFIVRVR